MEQEKAQGAGESAGIRAGAGVYKEPHGNRCGSSVSSLMIVMTAVISTRPASTMELSTIFFPPFIWFPAFSGGLCLICMSKV